MIYIVSLNSLFSHYTDAGGGLSMKSSYMLFMIIALLGLLFSHL